MMRREVHFSPTQRISCGLCHQLRVLTILRVMLDGHGIIRCDSRSQSQGRGRRPLLGQLCHHPAAVSSFGAGFRDYDKVKRCDDVDGGGREGRYGKRCFWRSALPKALNDFFGFFPELKLRRRSGSMAIRLETMTALALGMASSAPVLPRMMTSLRLAAVVK